MKRKKLSLFLITLTILTSITLGIGGGILGYFIAEEYIDTEDSKSTISDVPAVTSTLSVIEEESAIIDVAEKASEAVVSVVVSTEFNSFGNIEFRNSEPQLRQIGSGSGFLISKDGLIITNRHVVSQEDASYTIVFNDGTEKDATVLARDTLLDIAFVKVEGDNYPFLELGSSENVKVGQSAIAIGNALGEFSNTVSVGIVSGLGRDIIAGDRLGTFQELIAGVIQTDASINPGNSGGPLLNLSGEVIGVNVAVAAEGENIGFAIPIDVVKDLIDRLNEKGEIDRPILGVRYRLVNEEIQDAFDLDVDYGALIISGEAGETAVLAGSPADEIGLKEGDIILEVDGIKIDEDNTLQELIQKKYIGDSVEILILTEQGNEIDFNVELYKF